jgi:hypothetical protein
MEPKMSFSAENVQVAAARELDLGIRQIEQGSMACPYGALEMNVRSMACPYGALEMNRRSVTATV